MARKKKDRWIEVAINDLDDLKGTLKHEHEDGYWPETSYFIFESETGKYKIYMEREQYYCYCTEMCSCVPEIYLRVSKWYPGE